MKVLLLPKYDTKGPSSRYRTHNYLPYFTRNNINYLVKPLFGNNYIDTIYSNKKSKILKSTLQIKAIFKRFSFLLFKRNQYDLIIIEKELFPNMPFFIEFMLLYKKKYSLDFDDYVATSYKLNPIKKIFLYHKIDKLVKKAVFTTVGNQWYFKEFKSKNLSYLPTVIDLNKYPNIKEHYMSVDNQISLVWIGSPSTVKYLFLLSSVLQKLAKKYAFKLRVIGAEITIKNVAVELIKWTEASEVSEIIKSDIGIMPLENTLWEKGKCGFKLIQYMACGLPVIGTKSPANEEIIEEGINGYVAATENDWLEKLSILIEDAQLRKKFGAKGRQRVASHYSYQIWGKRYMNIIQQGSIS